MKKRSIVIVLAVALLLVLSIAGTAVAAKAVPTITDASLTFKSVEGAYTYYNYSMTFTGRPYQYAYRYNYADNFYSYSEKIVIDGADLKDKTINNTTGISTGWTLESLTFYLYDRKGNQLGVGYTVPPAS